MDLQEITSLISIRDYASRSVEDLSLPREKALFLQELRGKMDKKIGSLLLGSDFQDYLEEKKMKLKKELQTNSNDLQNAPTQMVSAINSVINSVFVGSNQSK